MPTPRSNLAAGVIDGNLYALGGRKPGVADTYYSTVEAYNPKADNWTTKAPIPTPCALAAAAVIDGNLYLVGCEDSFFQPRTVQVYDPKTNTWTSRSPMPTPRHGLTVAVVDGILYAIGGHQPVPDHFTGTVEAFDPNTNTWSGKAPMPTNRGWMATGVVDGIIYVAGGVRGVGASGLDTLVAVEGYDPKTDTWTSKAPMPTRRSGVSSGVLAGELYVVGGTVNQQADLIKSTVEIYAPKTNSWRAADSIPTPRMFAGAGVIDDTLYVVGGYPALSVNEAFSPFLHVGIDIKPGDARNTINLKSEGVVAVAILGSATFNPLTVDPSTVTLAGAPVATKGKGQPMTSQGDFNYDGYLDLLLFFRTQDLQLAPGATEAVLYGTTTTGQRIRGADSVHIIRFAPAARSNPLATFDRRRNPTSRTN